ncbi:MAG: SH3 domain-containing protein [Desulfobacterales bacterium]|nr:SH3 domain-containing protein [Desulfobacterales bacterium]MCP4159323.1 SH3 domain-containing protein [Deltaproteobacteria bacterium]
MKKFLSLFLLFIFIYQSGLANTNSKNTKYSAWVDSVRVRKTPGFKSKTITFLKVGETIYSTGIQSKTRHKITMRGIHFNEYFIKIKTKKNQVGWVFKGELVSSYQFEVIKNKIELSLPLNYAYSYKHASKWKKLKWFGLFKTNNQLQLLKTKVKIKVNEGYNDDQVIITSLNKRVSPLFYISGIKHRNVITAVILNKLKAFDEKNGVLKFSFLKKRYILISESKNNLSVPGNKAAGYQWILFYQKKDGTMLSQIIARSLGSPPVVIWAGDMNGDNKIDLFLKCERSGWGNSVLLLSSKQKSHLLVNKIGEVCFWGLPD